MVAVLERTKVTDQELASAFLKNLATAPTTEKRDGCRVRKLLETLFEEISEEIEQGKTLLTVHRALIDTGLEIKFTTFKRYYYDIKADYQSRNRTIQAIETVEEEETIAPPSPVLERKLPVLTQQAPTTAKPQTKATQPKAKVAPVVEPVVEPAIEPVAVVQPEPEIEEEVSQIEPPVEVEAEVEELEDAIETVENDGRSQSETVEVEEEKPLRLQIPKLAPVDESTSTRPKKDKWAGYAKYAFR